MRSMNDKQCNKCGLLPQRPIRPKMPKCNTKKCCKMQDPCEDAFAFRKVLIPAALGDDITGKDKPVNGAYTNSYVVYEANGAQYLYDSFGVFTKLRDNVYTFSNVDGGWKVVDSNGYAFKHLDTGATYVLKTGANLNTVGTSTMILLSQMSKWDTPEQAEATDIILGKTLLTDLKGKIAVLTEKADGGYIAETVTDFSEAKIGRVYKYDGTLEEDYTDIPLSELGLTPDDIVIGATLVYDGNGTLAVATILGDENVFVTTITTSGGAGELENDLVVSNPLGRYAMGDTIEAGTTFETIFRGLLTNVYYPTLTPPSATLTYNMPTYAKVGSTITARAATLTLNRGSINPQYTAESSYRSGEATNYTLISTGADTEYSDSSTTSGSFNVNALTRATKGTIVLTGTISYAAGVQPKDSDGNDYDSPLPAGSVTASKTVTFIQPFYYGKTAGTSISDFTGLTEDITAKGQKKYKFTTNNEHMVIAYDSSYGDLTSILDANGFEVISGWTKSTLTVDGFSYYVWIANLATTDTNAEFTFKF